MPPERKARTIDVVRNSYGTKLGSRRLLPWIGPTSINNVDNECQGVINNEQAQSGFAPARFPLIDDYPMSCRLPRLLAVQGRPKRRTIGKQSLIEPRIGINGFLVTIG